MTPCRGALLILLFLGTQAGAETLHYSINWQSGLSLGEATLRSEKHSAEPEGEEPAGWKFDLSMDAAVPGFNIRDEYSSSADEKLCTLELQKSVTRGARKTVEKLKFDQENHTVTRETEDGGKSDYSVQECAHDAMSFLQFVREELIQGRMARQQFVILGAKYEVTLTYTGTETLKIGEESVETDRLKTVIKGPQARITADLFFSHDDVRTPVMARIPLEDVGTFTVKLLP